MPCFLQPNGIVAKIIHLLNTCTSPPQLHQIQAQIILHNLHQDTTITFNFINASKSLGFLHSAFALFNQIPRPHVFICNNLMKALSHSQMHQLSILIYTNMHKSSIRPNNYTFPFILKSLSDLRLLKNGQTLHAHILKFGHYGDLYIGNSLLDLYSSCGEMNTCEQMFDEMPQRDAVSWTILISGHRNAGNLNEAMLAFERMQFSGLPPNRVTMVNALSACAMARALEMGVWIHDYIKRAGWELDVVLGTSLIDMYGQCGRIEVGLSVFDSMVEKNVFTWNSIIKGLTLAKKCEEALSWFFRMEKEGIKADRVSLILVLRACSHSGLVQMGRDIFYSMMDGKYGILLDIKHYGCMVDLLGRSGFLNEAQEIIERMPFGPNTVILESLLTASRAHGDLKVSEYAASRLVEMEPWNGAYHAFLSSLYAEMGKQNHVEEVKRLMKE